MRLHWPTRPVKNICNFNCECYSKNWLINYKMCCSHLASDINWCKKRSYRSRGNKSVCIKYWTNIVWLMNMWPYCTAIAILSEPTEGMRVQMILGLWQTLDLSPSLKCTCKIISEGKTFLFCKLLAQCQWKMFSFVQGGVLPLNE